MQGTGYSARIYFIVRVKYVFRERINRYTVFVFAAYVVLLCTRGHLVIIRAAKFEQADSGTDRSVLLSLETRQVLRDANPKSFPVNT